MSEALLERQPVPLVQAGKFLTFRVGGESYGLEILRVQEIIGMMAVTHVPRTPEYVRGVINLRGKVIPVMELRLKFGMEGQEDTPRTCIIVVQVSRDGLPVTMGVIVDEVSEVLDISASQLEPPPSFGLHIDTEFILGMCKAGEKVILLLDADRVLSSQEMDAVADLGNGV